MIDNFFLEPIICDLGEVQVLETLNDISWNKAWCSNH